MPFFDDSHKKASFAQVLVVNPSVKTVEKCQETGNESAIDDAPTASVRLMSTATWSMRSPRTFVADFAPRGARRSSHVYNRNWAGTKRLAYEQRRESTKVPVDC